ncbi:MAG TPA: adenosylcobinamide-GDP ribazoletransferase [Longimicrobiales bacterium]
MSGRSGAYEVEGEVPAGGRRGVIPAGLRAALRHLTVVPVPYRGAEAAIAPARALPWFPVVGAVVGSAVAAVLALPLPPLPRAALALGAWVALTGGLHEDGLMDSADAAFAPVPRERRLEILEDPRVGAHGATAGALSLLLRFAALAAVPAAAPVPAAVAGRWLMTLSLAWWRPARPDGLGAGFAAGATATGPTLVALGLLAAVAAVVGPARTAAAAAAALVAGLCAAAWLARRFGGLTGDAHGAAGIAAETAALLALLPLCGGGHAC